MAWNDISTAGMVILAFFGALAVIGTGIKVIKEWIDPMKEQDERIAENEKRIEQIENDSKRANRILSAQSKLLIEISTHMITGNDIEKLTKKRDDLTNVIIEEAEK